MRAPARSFALWRTAAPTVYGTCDVWGMCALTQLVGV